METIAIAPVTPAPVNEAQTPRDAREEDVVSGPGFAQALKLEMALLTPEGAQSAAEDPASADAVAAAAAAAATADSAALPDAASAADPTIAQLAGQSVPMLQPAAVPDQAAAGLPSDATTATATATTATATAATATAAAPTTSVTTATAAAPVTTTTSVTTARMDQTGLALTTVRSSDLTAIRSSAFERNRIEPRGLEQNATQRQTLDRGGPSHGGGELRGAYSAREADDSLFTRGHTALDTVAEARFSAFVAERVVASDVPAAPAHSTAPLDGLSSTSLLAKWALPQSVASDASPTPASARIDTPLGASGWGDAFQQKIVWLVDRQQQSAELHVNPPHLGPVEIMLSMDDEGARIAFCSPHAAVREAIEASLPDLRTALGERGLSLGEAMVSADSGAAREQLAQNGRGSARHDRATPPAPVADSPTAQLARRGLVDIFA